MEDSSLYRNPTGDFSVGDFPRNPSHYLRVKKITSSMVTDQLDCTFLCVGEPKCYSFNMATHPDSKGLYLCEFSPCESDPCKNGADCVPDYEMNSYRCRCKLGFCGTYCERRENKSCSAIKLYNPKAPSGSYVIDPDGDGGTMRAMEDSSLYRNPTGDFSVGDFQRNPFHHLWVKKITSSMVADQLDCTFLCVGEPKCYSFNMAAYPDSKGLYLCWDSGELIVKGEKIKAAVLLSCAIPKLQVVLTSSTLMEKEA
ncbi:Basement membrane-specific heparan sulfate proteoglycan core protein [Desmophyllum pertusum]|uniref:Basement membrane-specific heparan sulfate proteoglycan core protein n=1 Tax=Desmophyllum pertusum TaxID=174260 RepID=A0A9X0CQZ7_9CNID|nr:Basement membrane-specific heparan sulfate proteoglycan core protein [Desmophyllum pertusum]